MIPNLPNAENISSAENLPNPDGYVKFRCEWIKDKHVPGIKLAEINKFRGMLYKAGLIGACENGVGFGNISVRISGTDNFIITGTETGNHAKLGPEHYTSVVGFDIDKNSLACRGPIRASSESLTHAAVYLSDPNINCVVHVHNLEMWNQLKNKVPTTSPTAEYGTPEMANEIIRLFKEMRKEVMGKQIIAMAGHEEGLISFGKTVEEAADVFLTPF